MNLSLEEQANKNAKLNALMLKNQEFSKPVGDFIRTRIKPTTRPSEDELLDDYSKKIGREPVSLKKLSRFDVPDIDEEDVSDNKEQILFLEKRIYELQNQKKVLAINLDKKRNELKALDETRKEYLRAVKDGTEKVSAKKNIDYNEKKSKLTKEIQKIQDEIRSNDSLISQMNQDIINLEGITQAIENNNESKLEEYNDMKKILKTGTMTIKKLPNETDEEYSARVEINTEVVVPKQELSNAKAYTRTEFRDLMKEIVRSPVIIEQVANAIDDLGEVDNKYTIIKNWNFIKNKFINTYGLKNKNINASDIINFFKLFLDVGESGMNKVIEQSIVSNDGYDYIQVNPVTEDNTLMLVNNLTDKYLFLKSVIDDGSKYVLLYSTTNENGSYKEFIEGYKVGGKPLPPDRKVKSSVEVEEKTGIKPVAFNKIFDIYGSIVNPEMVAKKLKSKYNIEPLSNMEVMKSPYTPKKGNIERIQYGYGVKSDDIPKYANFGKLIILLRKLYYDNVLSVKTAQMKSIAGFKSTKVSEKFVSIIMNMMDGLQPTYQDINNLTNPERMLYDRLLTLAQLFKTYPNQRDKTISDLKKRMHLVESEIEIGNNNPMLKKELYEILHSLKDFKLISQRQINEYLKQLK